MTNRRYDVIKDKPDPRDKFYKNDKTLAIPTLVDMRNICPPIEDQGQLGSCTAHGIAGALEFLELREFRDKQKNQPQEFAGQGLQRMSRLFIYFNERALEGTVSQDAGAEIRDGVKSLYTYGVCDENLWPYDINQFAVTPFSSCFQQAVKHKISQYVRLSSVDDIIGCVASRFPVVIGIQVFQSFESPWTAQTGQVPMPQWGERQLGGHCVLIVGYDLNAQVFIVRNSWGTGWGLQGYFTLPFAYLANPSLSGDFWTIKR